MASNSRSDLRLRAVSEPSDPVHTSTDVDPQRDADAMQELWWVAQARNGNAATWARLYQSNFDRLYRDVRYLVSDATAAEEIAQESFAIALTTLDRFDGRASFLGWLRGIAHNLVRRRWRTEDRRGRAYERLLHTESARGPRAANDPEAAHMDKQRAAVLKDVLTTLPEPLRETFIMRDVQGLSVDEVAQRLGTTPGNVRVRANRARAKIRERLEALGWLAPAEAS
jgi:RNA polymerase sigma-70 factor (ECF subfamily)